MLLLVELVRLVGLVGIKECAFVYMKLNLSKKVSTLFKRHLHIRKNGYKENLFG